jgi:hypothetical protein
MQQSLHLLITRAATGEALAARYGSRWLLPIISCDERMRADPKAVRWCADRDIECEVVGQWLGRISPQVTDWLMVLSATHGDRPSDRQLMWTPLAALISRPALIEYQGWAIRRVMEGGSTPSVPGPFGRFDWLDDVKEWIRAVAGEPACRRIRQFRSRANEVVLCVRARCGDVYFKGLVEDRAREPRITQTLSAVAAAHFARTLAVEERADGSTWWLTASCPGVPAANGEPVAHALAKVQRRLMNTDVCERILPLLDLDAALRWGTELVDGGCVRRIETCLSSVLSTRAPRTWIPMDLHPTNALVSADGAVRFIDIDESFFGPAPLAAALFATRSRDASIRAAYERSWSPAFGSVDWAAFEAAAGLVEAWLGWQRLERKVRGGEVHGAFEIATNRIRQRLSSAFQRR